MKALHLKVIFLLLCCPLWALAADRDLPSWLPLAPGMEVAEVHANERYGEAVVPTAQQPKQLVRGHHWSANLKLRAAGSDASGKAIWARWKPTLLQSGWGIAEEPNRNPFAVSLRQTQGRDAWLHVTLFAADDIRIELVEVGHDRWLLKLPAPMAKSEELKADKAPFPFLPPPPGAKFNNAAVDDTPMLVTVKDNAGNETRLQVANGSISKYYYTPRDLSNLDFALAYRDALLAAGWKVLRFSQSPNSSDTLLVAHYGVNGRDLWAQLQHAPGEAQFIVGDAGRSDMAQALKKDCRVTLLGVLFDFDKATLKPESDAVLTRAHVAIKANPGLALEVQGHTDAVGSEAYNQKLSEDRAQSVRAWLLARGIAAAQLTARGYGKQQPVADNDTDNGRARNRRVELSCRK